MKGTDKFLLGIVVGVILLVIVAVAAVMTRPAASYKEENTAEGVVNNYLLALQRRDYARAYSYLSPSLKTYPATLDRFIETLRGNRFAFPNEDDASTLEIDSSRTLGTDADSARVAVRETHFYNGGLFGGGQESSHFFVELQRENGAWKIYGSNRYFLSCWTTSTGCK